jgi:hypothetical protein
MNGDLLFEAANLFVGTGADGIMPLLERLENQLPLLGDADRDFIIGCKLLASTGGVITPQTRKKLFEIAKQLDGMEHDMLGGAVDKPLSIPKVLKELAQNIHTLTPKEKELANMVVAKLRAKEPLAPKEVEKLLEIYFNKGF